MESKFSRVFFRLSGAGVLLLVAGVLPARAASPVDVIAPQEGLVTATRTASTQGLDLTSPADQAVLVHRVHTAAWHACVAVAGGEAIADDDLQRCIESAVANASPRVREVIASAQARAVVASARQ